MSDPSRDALSTYYVCRCSAQHRHRLACFVWRWWARMVTRLDDSLWEDD